MESKINDHSGDTASRRPEQTSARVRWLSHQRIVAFSVAAILLVIAGFGFYERHQYVQYEDQAQTARREQQKTLMQKVSSGTQFLLGKNGHFVGAELQQLPDVRRGDSLSVVFRLSDLGKAPSTAGLGQEQGGRLTPTLTVGDCIVTPQEPALAKSTEQDIAAYVWQWSVDDCKTSGYKAVQLLLAYSGSGPKADPVAYRELAFVHVTDVVSTQDVITLVATLATVLGACAGIIGALKGKKADR
jgi:hypothetical protein